MGNVTEADLIKELEQLRAENEALKAKSNRPLTAKVSAKGAVSVYGLGRFPATFYKEQWLKIINFIPKLEAFMKQHDSELAVKEK